MCSVGAAGCACGGKHDLNPQVWGRAGWRLNHAIAHAYPDAPSAEDRAAVGDYFRSLARAMPCSACCSHYAQELKDDPVEPHLTSRAALQRWLLALHNRVNARLGKPALTAEAVRADLERPLVPATATASQQSPNAWLWALVLAALVLGVVLGAVVGRRRPRQST